MLDDLPQSYEEMNEVIKRSQSGDKEVLPVLRLMLEHVPEICDTLGANLEQTVEDMICSSLGGEENLGFQEAIRRKMAVMRSELEGPMPSPIERLLVERIVACWLQVQEADLCASNFNSGGPKGRFFMKRQDRAHRRFLSAVKTLATIRKMALPTLQINIGQNQVNMAGAKSIDAD
jgi:hypothetical protein